MSQDNLGEVPLTKREFTVVLLKRLWNDSLAWATMWPLIFTILIFFKDKFFVLNNAWLIAWVMIFIGALHLGVLVVTGAKLSANALAASASPFVGQDMKGVPSSITPDDMKKVVSRSQVIMARTFRVLLIASLAILPLKATNDAMVESLRLKLLTDCLIDKIEAVEQQLPQKECKKLNDED